MKDETDEQFRALRGLRLTARALSLISIGVILLFFIGEGFNPATISLREWVLFACFPAGVVAGMVTAWRSEIVGGLLTGGSLPAFYLLHSLMSQGTFPRGWAFLVCGLLEQGISVSH